MGTRLIIFARDPEPGQVKTRLARAIGAEAAAKLYAAFVTDTVTRLARRFETVLCAAPDTASPFFRKLVADTGVRSREQPRGDLGTRMAEALHRELAGGADAALLIGTDLPTLPEGHLIDAERLLAIHRLVFGPSSDGGYWLAGASRSALPHWEREVLPLFAPDLPWSTGAVLRDTLRRATAHPPALAACWTDVDEPHDLAHLVHWLQSAPPDALPATHAALAGMAVPGGGEARA